MMQAPPEDRYELALRASNEGIWQWDVQKGYVSYSDRVLSFLGYEEGAEAPNIFMRPEYFFHENDVAKFERALAKMLEPNGEEIFAIDCRYIRPDEAVTWLRIRGACIRDASGETLRMAGSMIDISKRKNAELALEEERHLLNQLIENIPSSIYFKDTESRFVMVNKALAHKMGYENVHDLYGLSDHDVFDDAHANKSRADELRIMATGEPLEESLEREVWGNQPDTWVLTTKLPWHDRNGKVKGIFGVSSDVTDIVSVQIRLANVTEELKHRNEEYAQELELARQIQYSVIDSTPLPFPRDEAVTRYGVEFSSRYLPDSEMAGDFFENLKISDTKVGVLICDVMGHGVRASLVVAMLRGLVEKERESSESADWFLYGLNDSLAKILNHAGIQMFATAFYAVVDLEKETFQYASAGHPMPFIKRNGKVEVLSSEKIVRGPALGLMPEAPYGADTLPLSEIEQLIMYTDGIYEVENSKGEQIGVEGLCAILNKHPKLNADEALHLLMQSAKDFTSANSYGDDVCMFAFDVIKNG
ncbi:SpoIIE family protein phosphatase [Rubritalea spongiae]|uniref:SpoIIE family protein phosphatase n=1 Tax=Rubritalea spongiae TaxID=430797 RepID=A0ABW5DZU3_9BACT